MKISVALDCRGLEWTGIGTYLKKIIPALIKSGEVRMVCLGKTDTLSAFRWSEETEIVNIDSEIFSPGEQVELLLKAPKCDLLWVPHFNVPLFYGGKLLVTVHDALVLAMPQHIDGIYRKLYAKAMFGGIKRRADAVISVSEFTKNELVRIAGFDADKIYPIHSGVDSSWGRIQKKGNPHIKPFLLYVGNIKPHKNLVTLFSAFQSVLSGIPHDLIIIGEKDNLRTVDRAAIESAERHKDRIRFVGHVSDEALEQYYTYAEALILPSFYEGFGFPALEAMASGCPVIAARAASLPEVCGNAALYCDPYSPEEMAAKIMTVITDVDMRQALKRDGLERAKQFTWEKTAAGTLDVIKAVAGRN